jgi:hypothetical protein
MEAEMKYIRNLIRKGKKDPKTRRQSLCKKTLTTILGTRQAMQGTHRNNPDTRRDLGGKSHK